MTKESLLSQICQDSPKGSPGLNMEHQGSDYGEEELSLSNPTLNETFSDRPPLLQWLMETHLHSLCRLISNPTHHTINLKLIISSLSLLSRLSKAPSRNSNVRSPQSLGSCSCSSLEPPKLSYRLTSSVSPSNNGQKPSIAQWLFSPGIRREGYMLDSLEEALEFLEMNRDNKNLLLTDILAANGVSMTPS